MKDGESRLMWSEGVSTTSVIKEPDRPEVRVKSSDIAKCGSRNERDTALEQYIERRPKKAQKILEQKIANHRKDLLKKDMGSKKIKRNKRQTDVSVISSGRSRISTSSNAAVL